VRAAWYERQGPAREVLAIGDMEILEPASGEVRVRLSFSGVNPGDIKKREGWLDSAMPYPRVIPHSDGAGVIDAVGPGVDPARIGRRVWVFGAQSYRPFGTAAEATVVPDEQAVSLPDAVSDEVGATLGIPGITAHRTVFADGAVDGQLVLVHGVLGAVGSFAAQLAHHYGATVIGTVLRQADLERVPRSFVPHAIALEHGDAADRVRDVAAAGVDRIIEVALSANADLDAAVIAPNGIVAAYSTLDPRPSIPFWPLLFANTTIRLFGSDDFPADAKQAAARDITELAASGSLHVEIGGIHPLNDIAVAHETIESGARGRILVRVTERTKVSRRSDALIDYRST
jgi:NADPH2:quinone reductase